MSTEAKVKTKKAQRTNAKLLKAAQAVFASKGFYTTTVNHIVKEAGVGYGTFYLYYTDKKDIFYALIEQVEDALYTAAEGGSDLSRNYEPGLNSYRALRRDLRAVFQSFIDHANIISIMREIAVTDMDLHKRYLSMRNRLINRTEQILQKSNLTGMDFKTAAIGIAGMIEAIANELINSARGGGHLTIDQVLPTVTKLYFKAVS